jgi:uncharacterized protein YjbI with pentapeptide repeats
MVAVQQGQQYASSDRFSVHYHGEGADIVANESHVSIVKRGKLAVEAFLRDESELDTKRPVLDLSRANLSGENLSEMDLRGAILSRANLTGANLRGVKLHGAELDGVVLDGADLRSTYLVAINMRGASLIGAHLDKSNLIRAKLGGVSLHNAHLNGTNLSYADLSSANLSGAILHDTNFTGADLRGVNLAANTQFNEGTIVSGMTVNASSSEHLREKLGTARMMDLIIENDLVTLRCEFDGVGGLMHLGSIIAFFAPHVFFLLKMWWLSTDRYPEGGLVLWKAVLRYAFNGGVNWRDDWYFNHATFWSSAVFLFYNALRMALLVKTKKLMMIEAASRLPVKFSFTDRVWDKLNW